MRVLVTGGSGFIGTHVLRALAARGAQPVVLDPVQPRLDGADWIKGSVLDEGTVAKAVQGVDAVVHLASILSVAETERRPWDTLDTALLGTRTVCEALQPGQRVILASTSEVYGDAAVVPTPESHTPSPKSVYGVAKLAAEAYTRSVPSRRDADFTILRYFSVYGPGQRPSFVIPKFVARALAGEPLELIGDGRQVRAFLHVDDAARATVAALYEPSASGRTYNVGNPAQPVSMAELADLVLRATGSRSDVRRIPFEASDRSAQREIYRRIPLVDAAREDFGFVAVKTLEEGIADVIQSLR